MYTEKDFVQVAKRENNKKRNYLVVNRLQGKHVPVKASEAFHMMDALAATIQGRYEGETLLFIGFAETATAIGAAVAHAWNGMYMQTTREELDGVEYLYFSEEHSHATEQKLVKTDIDQICDRIDRIIFVEDEVTTGKTIQNIVSILKVTYPMIHGYSVMSILNGMKEDALETYRKEGIDLFWLVKTDHDHYGELAEHFAGDGSYIKADREGKDGAAGRSGEDIQGMEYGGKQAVSKWEIGSYLNARRLVTMKDYDDRIEFLCSRIKEQLKPEQYRSILVIGTEEFMYPAMRVAERLEAFCPKVQCHSTTRSPIMVSREEEYPLHTRYQLKSLYDRNRTTYVYDLEKCECVLIITDGASTEREGLDSLLYALQLRGNDNIKVIRWC